MAEPPLQRLRFDLTGPLPAAAWPAGVSVRTFQAADAAAVHALMAAGYALGGGSVGPLESWWPALRNDAEFDPQLCFLAFEADGRLVGAVQCWTSSFVKDLVVRADARRRGIGEALLLTALAALKARGAGAADLKVQTDNPHGAKALYAKLGGRRAPIDG